MGAKDPFHPRHESFNSQADNHVKVGHIVERELGIGPDELGMDSELTLENAEQDPMAESFNTPKAIMGGPPSTDDTSHRDGKRTSGANPHECMPGA